MTESFDKTKRSLYFVLKVLNCKLKKFKIVKLNCQYLNSHKKSQCRNYGNHVFDTTFNYFFHHEI